MCYYHRGNHKACGDNQHKHNGQVADQVGGGTKHGFPFRANVIKERQPCGVPEKKRTKKSAYFQGQFSGREPVLYLQLL
jgi:hypothetical protein